jgi:hypothetical protein
VVVVECLSVTSSFVCLQSFCWSVSSTHMCCYNCNADFLGATGNFCTKGPMATQP